MDSYNLFLNIALQRNKNEDREQVKSNLLSCENQLKITI